MNWEIKKLIGDWFERLFILLSIAFCNFFSNSNQLKVTPITSTRILNFVKV